jgi:zinc transport system permease protein
MSILTEPFFLRALAAGTGIAVLAGPIGCFIVWRRMAYFGETLAHGSLLGIGLGLMFGIDTTLGVIASTIAIALALFLMRRERSLATDTLLGILSHTALAAGLIVASLLTWVRFDLMALLFGDILTVGLRDIILVWAGGAAALGVLAWLWRDLLALTVHEELARAEGVNRRRTEFIFVILIAFVIAAAMKIVGILLITALLIIPAAAARQLARTPESMALMASGLGIIAVVAGLALSGIADTPSGPSVVIMAAALYLLTLGVKRVTEAS